MMIVGNNKLKGGKKVNNGNLKNIHKDALKGFHLSGGNKNTKELENGKFIFSDFSRYGSKLNLILEDLNVSVGELFTANTHKNVDLISKLKLDFSGIAEILEGNFIKIRRGNSFFNVTDKEKSHFLIKIKWGGSYHPRSRGLNERRSFNGILYLERISSNKGELGIDYIVVPKDFQQPDFI